MLLIYTPCSSKRLVYTFDLVFKNVLNTNYQLIHNIEEFQVYKQAKFNYSQQKISQELFFFADSLLFETIIKRPSIQVNDYEGTKAFFFHNNLSSILPFDPFALIFFLVSRYEEYCPHQKDVHGRFNAHQSLAYQAEFLNIPLANIWSLYLSKLLKKHFSDFESDARKYKFLPTYDVDFAWSYKNKGFFRNLGAYLKDLTKLNIELLIQRTRVHLGVEEDPFFTFGYLDELHKGKNLEARYFFLVGKRGEFDKNISISNIDFQKLIQRVAQKYPIGLHPSYQSNGDKDSLIEEHENLKKLTTQSIEHSRQHFLKLNIPQTYRNLLSLGIKHDYTMGYAKEIGFRASIACPFQWYDLEREEATELWIHPFQLLDVSINTTYNYCQMKEEEILPKVIEIINAAKLVGGEFVTVFHNNSFCEQQEWVGWRAKYEQIIKAAM